MENLSHVKDAYSAINTMLELCVIDHEEHKEDTCARTSESWAKPKEPWEQECDSQWTRGEGVSLRKAPSTDLFLEQKRRQDSKRNLEEAMT
ncbi:hypothetical protein KM043_009176 [Ampulex compressa]|nr:hypothetical protein KM043_009176 [Ampulex compressa]